MLVIVKKSTNKKRSQQKLTKKIKFNKQKINSLIGQQQYKKEKKSRRRSFY